MSGDSYRGGEFPRRFKDDDEGLLVRFLLPDLWDVLRLLIY